MHNERVLAVSRAISVFALVGACAAFAACGLDVGGSMDVAPDAESPHDGAGNDAPIGVDGALDASIDAPTDATMPDGGADAAPDAAADASMDARADVGADAGIDSAIDSAADSAPDSSPDSAPDAPVDAPPDATCSITNGCVVVPAGWSLVAIDTAQPTAACPTGFANAAPVDVVESPNVGANACACQACSISTPPDCNAGAVKVFYDLGGMQCGAAGVPAQNDNNPAGACNSDMYQGSYANLDLKYVPPAATGAACAAPAVQQKQNVTYGSHARTCAPDSAAAAGCNGNECTPSLASPFSACIAMSGNQTCPAPMTVKHLVGTDVSYTCSACPCTVSATCSGTMSLYEDNNCTMGLHPIAADGQCHPSGTNKMFRSYKYAGTASNVSCSAGNVPAPQNVALVGQETICCAP